MVGAGCSAQEKQGSQCEGSEEENSERWRQSIWCEGEIIHDFDGF